MLIVSQNKKIITESLELSIEPIESKKEKKIVVQEYCGELYPLGIYATEERAQEVLQDIISFYIRNEMQNKVYRMPKE